MRISISFCFAILLSQICLAQSDIDSTRHLILDPLTVEGLRINQDIRCLAPIQGTYIYSGKKTEVIDLTQKNIAITEKYARQIFAKIPGIFVYDMDGTGNQMNISTRGLDPHRGWEFNIRKDGVVTNSDMYGYPASHYNIPMEAVDHIEFVRGTGSLQYGAQFGGMMNYISKQPDTTRQIAFETINTIGSNGLVSTYSSASGKINKVRYSAWLNKKWITGYRDNSDSEFDSEGLSLFYDPAENLSIKLEYTHSNYITHLPGPLTDNMFHADPTQSTRARNYYQPNISIPSITLNWKINESTELHFISSAVLGARNSVLFDKPATTPDSIVTATLQFNNRQVDIDHFNSYTNELRFLKSYRLMKQTSALSIGAVYMNNDLHRQQLGKGTTGSDFDLTLVTPGFGRDMHLKTSNIAFFAENRWALTRRLSFNTGMRMEIGETNMTGIIINYPENKIPNTIKHSFPLFGVNAQYDFNTDNNLYAGWSQAYRPVIFKDIIPSSAQEEADKDLKDAFGYNAELGWRGKWKSLKWDITGFMLQYNNRLGARAVTNEDNVVINYKTNIGDSHTMGIELFLQKDFTFGRKSGISVFTSTSLMDARYDNATIKSGNDNVSVDGNKVESVPTWITRNGFTLKYSRLSLTGLYSYTAESYADALNTVAPSISGSVGLVPSFQIVDLNLALQLTDKI
ncbi:MAG: TonB-dependent receptor [Saprospiraceae bacterium]